MELCGAVSLLAIVLCSKVSPSVLSSLLSRPVLGSLTCIILWAAVSVSDDWPQHFLVGLLRANQDVILVSVVMEASLHKVFTTLHDDISGKHQNIYNINSPMYKFHNPILIG